MQQEQAEQNGDANRNKESVPTSSDATAAVKPPIDQAPDIICLPSVS